MHIDTAQYNETAELLKVIAHPVRLCIVRGLWQGGGCNVSHMQDCLDIPQSTISQHLQKLRAAGIIQGKRSGLEVHYSIRDPRVKNLLQVLFPDGPAEM